MELVRVASGDYSRYEELLLRRDELEKEAELILLEYTRIFGDITTEIFKLKVECIALKKSISYCIMMKNRRENVDPDKLAEYKSGLEHRLYEASKVKARLINEIEKMKEAAAQRG